MLNYIKHLPTGILTCCNRRNEDGVELIDWMFGMTNDKKISMQLTTGTAEIKMEYFAVGRWVNGFNIKDANGDTIFVRLTDVINRNRIAR